MNHERYNRKNNLYEFLRLFFSKYPTNTVIPNTTNTPIIPAYRLVSNLFFIPGTVYPGRGASTEGLKSSFLTNPTVSFDTFSSPSGICEVNGIMRNISPIIKDKPNTTNNGILFLVSLIKLGAPFIL